MFCSGRPKNHTQSSWFLNRAGNPDPCYSLVGVPTPENLTLWWEPKQNTLYLEDRTQDASQHLNPFLNALTAAGFAASGVIVSSQLLRDYPCSIMPCSSCKADRNPVLLPSLNPVMVSISYVRIKLIYPYHLFDQKLAP